MKTFICFLLLSVFVFKSRGDGDLAENQIVAFRNKTLGPVGIMTISSGTPITKKEASGTLNRRLIFHEFFMDSIMHFNRETIPARVVHEKGGGAFGYFVVTHDIRDICKARLFGEVGKKTPVAVRFSVELQTIGGRDTTRDNMGFAIKFYTEDGNFDLVGLNVPVFPVKDALYFISFVHSRKKNPQTFLYDPNMFWDFIVQRPETMHNQLYLFSDLGIPDGFRHIPGYSIHTYQVVNEAREIYFVRFHLTPDAGVKSLEPREALKIASVDPDYAVRDLYNSIASGKFPSWLVSVQVLSIRDVKNAGFDKYPLRPVGRIVLNRNPVNYFAEIEQLAFCPGNLVPGILGAPDKLFEGRRLAYRDTQNYRLGANFVGIRVNRPISETFTYNRDGHPPVGDNEGNIPNYYPNSYNGPVPYIEKNEVDLIEIFEEPADNFDQIRDFYNNLSLDERFRLIQNIVNSLRLVTDLSLKDRSVELLRKINPELGRGVWEGLNKYN